MDDADALRLIFEVYYRQESDLAPGALADLRDAAARESSPGTLRAFLRAAAAVRRIASEDAGLGESLRAAGVRIDPLASGGFESWGGWLGDLEAAMCAALTGSRELALDPDVVRALEQLIRVGLEATEFTDISARFGNRPWGEDMDRFLHQVFLPLQDDPEPASRGGDLKVTIFAEDVAPLRSLLDGLEQSLSTAASWTPATPEERRAGERALVDLRDLDARDALERNRLTVTVTSGAHRESLYADIEANGDAFAEAFVRGGQMVVTFAAGFEATTVAAGELAHALRIAREELADLDERSEPLRVVSDREGTPPAHPGKRAYLATHDYGMGGIWMSIVAHSSDHIRSKYPEFVVDDQPLSELPLRDQEAVQIAFDIEDDPPPPYVVSIVASRSP